jgi:hypothetical protein
MDAPLALLGLDEEGQKPVPETRLQTASDGRRLYDALVQEDNQGRSYFRALVKGMTDGNPPYAKKPKGRTWEANLNFREGTAIMNRTAVPYYNLFARVPYYADCKTNFQPDHPNYAMWNASITRRFHDMLKRWTEFNWTIQQVSYWMRLHGIGIALFDKDYDWRFRSVETGSVKVPKGAPSCLDKKIPYLTIEIPYRITELWERIKDPETAEKAGWNVENVRNAIKFGMKNQAGTDWYSRSWEWYEQRLKNHDLFVSFTDCDIVNCVMMLYVEFGKPGKKTKISKAIFTEAYVSVQNPTVPKEKDEDKKDFLYQDIECYENYSECIIPFFRNTGDGTWHSVRGFAMESYGHLEVDNRLLCQAVNRAFIDSSVVLASATARGRERLELAVWGTVVSLPTGSEFKPTTVQGGMDGPVQMHNLLRAHLMNNIGVAQTNVNYRQDGRGEMPTARQVDYQAATESSIGEGDITIFYGYLDSLFNTMFTRSVDPAYSDDEAKRFREECYDDGVPKEALKDMCYVRANRMNGYGSPELALMKLRQGMEIFPSLPEEGKQNFIESYVTTVFGPDKTESFAPRSHIPDDQDWQANVENSQMWAGAMPIIAGNQDDVQHLMSHLNDARQRLAPLAQSMDQGQQDMQALGQNGQYSQIVVQHCEEHIQRLKSDPGRRAQAKLFEDQLGQLGDFSQEIWRAFRTAQRDQRIQQEQEAQATALSALDQAKVESVRTAAAANAAKTQSQIENQRAKTAQQMQIKALKTGQDLNIDRVTTVHEINTQNAKTVADIQNKRRTNSEVPEEVLP